jgi:peroxin-12
MGSSAESSPPHTPSDRDSRLYVAVAVDASASADVDPFLSEPETPSVRGAELRADTDADADGKTCGKGAGAARFTIPAEAYGRCPLCGDAWRNPAVLPSGWVVCWRCGWDAVEGEEAEDEEEEGGEGAEVEQTREGTERPGRRRGRCPITGVPVARGQLRRVLV